ncbi:MAG: hypothetical protein WC812_03890 [Candidatus Pacearchaeota archaeon]|jgi:hypothetical protein
METATFFLLIGAIVFIFLGAILLVASSKKETYHFPWLSVACLIVAFAFCLAALIVQNSAGVHPAN